MGDLLVECPIHLDAVPVNDILVFKCGHGFCEPCLAEHFAHHAPANLSCPTCRTPVRRKEAFPLFLAPAQPSAGTQSSQPRSSTAEATHSRLTRELQDARTAHANCSDRFAELQNEIDILRRDGVRNAQTIQHLYDRYELLQERLGREVDRGARVKEERDQLKEEVTKLQVENQKTSRDLEEARKEAQVERERVKQFQGYTEQYKHKYSLEKKKRKAIENANHPPPREDESLMVVDANAPDVLKQYEPDFGWLDEACKVRGDDLSIPDDEDLEFGKNSEDEVQISNSDTKGKPWETRPGPPLQFSSDWNLGVESLGGPSSEATRRRRHGSGQVSGSKIVKVKIPSGVGAGKLVEGPLAVDRRGRIKGTVALGPRQKLSSKK